MHEHIHNTMMVEMEMPSKMGSSDKESYFLEDNQKKEVEKNVSGLKFSNIPGRSKYILCLCTLSNFFSGCSLSIMGPLYPNEAEKKGMEPEVIDFVFSIFQLIMFVSSPIIGNHLATIGPKYVYMTGIFVGGTCCVLFGTLHLSPPHTPFIVLSFVTRSVQAFGYCCFVTSLYAILSSEFPKHVTTVFGILQTTFGVGLMLGPIIGAALYELGGFSLPFYVMGIAVIINRLVALFLLPNLQNTEKSKRNGSIFSLITTPMVFIPMLSVCTGSLGIILLDPTLADHIEPFSLTTVTMSLFFVISPFMNSISSPVWGYLMDTHNIQGAILVLGHLFYGIGFLIIGPSVLLPFISFEIWTLVIGLVIIGVTFASILNTSMKCMVIGTLDHGFEDNIDTFGIVAGMYSCAYTLGGCFGPTLGGIIAHDYSLSTSFTVIGLISIGMAIVTSLFFLIKQIKIRSIRNSCIYEDNLYKGLSDPEDMVVANQED